MFWADSPPLPLDTPPVDTILHSTQILRSSYFYTSAFAVSCFHRPLLRISACFPLTHRILPPPTPHLYLIHSTLSLLDATHLVQHRTFMVWLHCLIPHPTCVVLNCTYSRISSHFSRRTKAHPQPQTQQRESIFVLELYLKFEYKFWITLGASGDVLRRITIYT